MTAVFPIPPDVSIREKLDHAHQAVMLQDAQALLKLSRDKNRSQARRGLPGMRLDPENSDVPAIEDEMGDIHIGDTIIHQRPGAAGGADPSPDAATTNGTSPSLLKKFGAGALIAATAAGGGAGGAALMNSLGGQNKPVPAAVQPATAAETPWDLKLLPEVPHG